MISERPAAPPKVSKPHSFRELGAIDIAPIKQQVLQLGEAVWELEDQRKANNFPCFHHTKHIVFRFIRNNADPRVFDTYPIWHIWSRFLVPVFDTITRVYRFSRPEYPKVMLARLIAGAVIDRHVDGAGSNLTTHKIHIPIQTTADATLHSNGETRHLQEGFAYEVNNIAPHAAENLGPTDRIHLIFETFDSDPASWG